MVDSGETDTRYEIFKTLVSGNQMMTLSEIAKHLKMDQQRVSYHLPKLVASGLVIKDGYNYFPQPIFLDENLHALCAEKLSDIVDGFSDADKSVIVGEGQLKEEIVIECLYALIKLVMPEHI
jgi:DNA-binding transcriptional ArsR family regulator